MNFVNDRCIVRGDVRVSVCDLRGAIMIYFHTTQEEKIGSVISSLLYEGHCTKASMIEYETGKPVHAMKGLKLRDFVIENQNYPHDEEETFVNMCCDYSPRRKAIFEDILDEYLVWRKRNGMEFDREMEGHILKDHLDNREQYIIAGHI